MSDQIEDPQADDADDADDGGTGDKVPERAVGGMFQDITGVGVDWRQAVLVPLLAVLTALFIGALIIALSDTDLLSLWRSDPLEAFVETVTTVGEAYWALLSGSLLSLRSLSETITRATPLIFAGLAVGLGFRAGLFNIGVQGQMLMGGMFATFAVITFTGLPWPFLMIVGIIAAIIGGGIWGGIPGLLRAKTGAHEVITTIMLNFIALRIVDYLLKTQLFQAEGRTDPVSETITNAAKLPRLLGFLDRSDVRIHAGFLLALLAAWFVYWLLFKSSVGFEFRSVGQNPDASRYAGMSTTWLIFLVMAISGALGGLAGANQIQGVLFRATPAFDAGIGFEAIALALLGRSHPAGIVAAALLFGALNAGGQTMQVETDIPIDLILVIQALVVVFIAAPALIRAIYRVRTGDEAARVTKGWAT